MVAVHNDFMAQGGRAGGARRRRRAGGDADDAAAGERPAARAAVRARHGIAADELVVGCFGLVTREKQVGVVARAVARAAVHRPAPAPVARRRRARRRARSRALLREAGVAGAHDRRRPRAASPSFSATSRPPTWWRTSAIRPRARPPPPCCARSPRDGRRRCPTSRTSPTSPPTRWCGWIRRTRRGTCSARSSGSPTAPPPARALGARARAFVREAHSPERCRADLRGGARARGRAAPIPCRRGCRATGAHRLGRERAATRCCWPSPRPPMPPGAAGAWRA